MSRAPRVPLGPLTMGMRKRCLSSSLSLRLTEDCICLPRATHTICTTCTTSNFLMESWNVTSTFALSGEGARRATSLWEVGICIKWGRVMDRSIRLRNAVICSSKAWPFHRARVQRTAAAIRRDAVSRGGNRKVVSRFEPSRRRLTEMQ